MFTLMDLFMVCFGVGIGVMSVCAFLIWIENRK